MKPSSSDTTSARDRTQSKHTEACPKLDSKISDLECGLSQKEHLDRRGLLRPVVNGHLPHTHLSNPVALTTKIPFP